MEGYDRLLERMRKAGAPDPSFDQQIWILLRNDYAARDPIEVGLRPFGSSLEAARDLFRCVLPEYRLRLDLADTYDQVSALSERGAAVTGWRGDAGQAAFGICIVLLELMARKPRPSG